MVKLAYLHTDPPDILLQSALWIVHQLDMLHVATKCLFGLWMNSKNLDHGKTFDDELSIIRKGCLIMSVGPYHAGLGGKVGASMV